MSQVHEVSRLTCPASETWPLAGKLAFSPETASSVNWPLRLDVRRQFLLLQSLNAFFFQKDRKSLSLSGRAFKR